MALRRLTLHQLAAVPRQIAKFPDGRRRNEARAEQPMAEQVGDPFRVFDIRLTARNFPDMLRIGRHDLQSPFQKGVDRLPVHPGALHGYLGATFREQPFPQAQQLARARAQCPNLLLNLPIPQSNQQTGHHGSLMHSEPTTAFYQGLHDASIAGRSPSTKACTMDRPVPHSHVRWCAKGACGLLRKHRGCGGNLRILEHIPLHSTPSSSFFLLPFMHWMGGYESVWVLSFWLSRPRTGWSAAHNPWARLVVATEIRVPPVILSPRIKMTKEAPNPCFFQGVLSEMKICQTQSVPNRTYDYALPHVYCSRAILPSLRPVDRPFLLRRRLS